MTYSIKITPVALNDLQAGSEYYSQKQTGLGKKFTSAVGSTFEKIQNNPLSASIAYEDIRYKIVKGFPYIVLYNIMGSYAVILRVFNTHLQPG